MVMGDLVREVDVAVVGGGPGGYSAAFRCAELGLETVVVDLDKRLGGACLFEGCIPSKALLHVAAVLSEAERAKDFGVDFGEPRISLDPLRKWKTERVVGKLSRGLAGVAKAKGVQVVGGHAAFEDSRSLRIGGDEPQVIRFAHAVIATGSTPARRPTGSASSTPRCGSMVAASSRSTSAAGRPTPRSTPSATSPASRCSRTALRARARWRARRSPAAPSRTTTSWCPRSSSPIRKSRGAASRRFRPRVKDAR